MLEAIQEWLGVKLGCVLDMSPENVAKTMRDGILLAKILNLHNIMNPEILSTLRASNHTETCYTNLRYLKPWLNCLGVSIEEEMLRDIAQCKAPAGLKLLHALYLSLDNRNHTFSTTEENCQAGNDKFRVEQVVTDTTRTSGLQGELEFKFVKPLIDKQEMISWYKKNYHNEKEDTIGVTKVEKKYASQSLPVHGSKVTDLKHARQSEETENYSMMKHESCEFVDYSYERLVNLSKQVRERPTEETLPNVQGARNFIKQMQHSRQHDLMSKSYQQKMCSVLLNDLSQDLVRRHEGRLHCKVSECMLKISQLEKQLTNKLLLVGHQSKVLTKNRNLISEMIQQQKEKELADDLSHQADVQDITLAADQSGKKKIAELYRDLKTENEKVRYNEVVSEAGMIIQALADMAVFNSEFRAAHGGQIPNQLGLDMKQLFYHNMNLFGYLDNIEDLKDKEVEGEILYGEENDGFELEIERQQLLDEADLKDYGFLLGPWTAEVLWEDTPQPEVEHIVLGYIVHRLLFAKYPLQELPKVADIKHMTPAAIVKGISNENGVEMLKNLLRVQNIAVICTEDAFNFVLQQYRNESNITDAANAISPAKTEPESKPSKLKQRKKRKVTLRKQMTQAKGEAAEDSGQVRSALEAATQTPSVFPQNGSVLTPAAEIGKTIFESVGVGNQVRDDVVVDAIVHYVKSIEGEHRGFVLINFPQNCVQAGLLERVLTGHELLSLEQDFTARGDVTDTCGSYRESYLVPNPIPTVPHSQPRTYFTHFMNVTVQKPVIESDTEEVVYDSLRDFYFQQNIYLDLTIPELDIEAVKKIGKVVCESIDSVTSLVMFENPVSDVEKILDTPHTTTSWEKTARSDESRSGPSTVPRAPPPSVSSYATAPPSLVPAPGDVGYLWADTVAKPMPHELLVALAGIWENMEAVYLNDLKAVFFCLRSHRAKIVPYCTLIAHFMNGILRKPDDKQRILSEFQYFFNNIDVELRSDSDIKCELHLRVGTLEDSLLACADERKSEAEDERTKLLRENWIQNELASVVNNFLTIGQLEADRCVDTLNIISDYYYTMKEKSQREKLIAKLAIPRLKAVPAEASTRTSKGVVRDKKSADAAAFVTQLLQNPLNDRDTPYHRFLTQAIEEANRKISLAVSEMLPRASPEVGKTKKRTARVSPDPLDSVIAGERTRAIHGELERFLFRTRLVQKRACLELDELMQMMTVLHHKVREEIEDIHSMEVKAVLDCCFVFRCCIEEETPLQQRLELDVDVFTVRHDVLLFPDPPSLPASVPEIDKLQAAFTVDELTDLNQKLVTVSPSGEIIRRAFLYILQDLCFMKMEEGTQLLPHVWSQLEPSDLEIIFREIYQVVDVVNWKDFIIYALDIAYPTQHELLFVRETCRKFDCHKKETISKNDFEKVEFWFEREPEVGSQRGLYRGTGDVKPLKDLLFRMYQVDADHTNYSALLLGLCKDADPAMGFIKGLALLIGKEIDLNDTASEAGGESCALRVHHDAYLACPPSGTKCACDTPRQGSCCSAMWDEVHPEQSTASLHALHTNDLSVSVVPMEVISNLILFSYPSASQLSSLLGSEETVKDALDRMFHNLTSTPSGVPVYDLLRHPLLSQILTTTNKFKCVNIARVVCDVLQQKAKTPEAN